MTSRTQRTRVAVIGGGMAGSAAARQLLRGGRDVVVYETADGLGGRARSWHRPEIEPDVGINLMYVSFYKLMTQLIKEYGLEDELVKISSNVWISDHGKTVPLSSDSPLSLLTYQHVGLRDRIRFLLSTLAQVGRKKQLDLFDPVKSAPFDDGQSATDWGYRQVSRRGFDFLLRPQIEGFWNFACEEISAVHARALLAWMGGSGFYVLRNGMEILAEKNAEGADIRLSHEVTAVQPDGAGVSITAVGPDGAPVTEEFDQVVVATPAPIAAKLVAALPEQTVGAETRSFLETQAYEPALSVSFLVDAGVLPAEAHIVAGGPEDPPLRNMITYPRTVRDEAGNPVEKLLVFAYPGRANTRRLLGRSPEEQFAEVTQLLPTLWPDFPVERAEPFQIAERPYGFPIPAPGRYRRSVRVLQEQRAPVVFAGDYFNSPTTEAAMLSGIRAAAALTKAG
ncbi:FAD-dependent oxidoreductase [Streptomyces luteolus]|uniref:FAD-dependent oxidoreductase n=1 Tax=Streptomyces luteolus TaxID=3043615 RepID=A0ABT6T7D7_9ACTN|nr:FAD-dependent oxidoreductase [Streptomyces sp. B-S-A12]MDI3422919.1 FAD-dependent oxidoreductase [Streptomyces sp. B-S-A12]